MDEYKHLFSSDILILLANGIFSIIGFFLVKQFIPLVSSILVSAGRYGYDMCKKNKKTKVPESVGIINGTIFLIISFLFLGIRFGQQFYNYKNNFPHNEFSESLTALLSICCMLFLGFADDVLNIKWRYKLVLPTIASLPLLMVYYINYGSTTIIVPKIMRNLFGFSVNIGILYYMYMSLLAVFCTNAINIYAGINGLESGQTVIMGCSVILFNLIELGGYQSSKHYFSVTLMLPFTATTLALFLFNKYPAKAFVGDTFTYFSGMTFAVVAILGHFSKTVLLFFIPQIFNFIYSTPQLFHIVPCPRHRLPKYIPEKDVLVPSEVEFKKKDLIYPVLLILRLLSKVRLVDFNENLGENKKWCKINNLTLINLTLCWLGPLHEKKLTLCLLALQVLSSGVAFLIRYPFANLFYD